MNVDPDETLEIEIFRDGVKTQVTCTRENAKECILAVCESLVGPHCSGILYRFDDQYYQESDDDTQLIELNDHPSGLRPQDFGKVVHQGRYRLETGVCTEPPDPTRLRRLKIQLPPFRHTEVTEALRVMQTGSNLLKHSDYRSPHIRQVQLSKDYKKLMWFTHMKTLDESSLMVHRIEGLHLGRAALAEEPSKRLHDFTFEITYFHEPIQQGWLSNVRDSLSALVLTPTEAETPALERRNLMLTCKDENEFDMWVTGLKALVHHFRESKVCKLELMSHSRRFRMAIKSEDYQVDLPRLPHPSNFFYTSIIKNRTVPLETTEAVLAHLQMKAKEINRLRRRSSLLSNRIPHVFTAECLQTQNFEMAFQRAHGLVREIQEHLDVSEKQLNQVTQNVADHTGESNLVRAVDISIWKAEVDTENLEDIVSRRELDMVEELTQERIDAVKSYVSETIKSAIQVFED